MKRTDIKKLINKAGIIAAVMALVLLTACGIQEKTESGTPEKDIMATTESGITETETQTAGAQSSEPEAEYTAQALKMPMTLREAIEMFPYIGRVEILTEPTAEGRSYFQEAKVVENYQGLKEAEIIPIRGYDTSLRQGEQYILFLQKFASVFTETEEFTAGEMLFAEEKGFFTDTITDLKGLKEEDVLGKLREGVRQYSYRGTEPVKGEYIHSRDLAEIVKNTPLIVKGTVSNVQQTSFDRCLADVRISEEWKGSATKTIRAVLPLTAEDGKDYVLLLKWADGVFIVSSPRSFFETDSPEAEQIRNLTDNK